jgi:hypothetical protein
MVVLASVLAAGLILLIVNWRARRHSAIPIIGTFVTDSVSSGEVEAKGFVDLKHFYNAGARTNWMGAGRVIGRDLAQLPEGDNSFGGVPFHIQEVVQLRGGPPRTNASFYPHAVKGIPVRMKCDKLHFLHGTAWSALDGTAVAAYDIHFADGSNVEVPVRYGTDVRDWSFDMHDVYQTNNTAWSSKKGRFSLRLFKTVWQNPKPLVQIKTIDFVSSDTASYPFLLGITAE